MGLFSKKEKQIVEPPTSRYRQTQDPVEQEHRDRAPEVIQQAEKYLKGNWDRVKINPGECIALVVNRDIERVAIQEKLVAKNIKDGFGKAKTKLVITDRRHIEILGDAVVAALRWNIPITDVETFALENPDLVPDMELRASFLNWLESQSYEIDSAFSSFRRRILDLKTGGEMIPGLSYAPSLYTYDEKLVFVDKRKEAVDLIVKDLGAGQKDGFAVVCDLHLNSADTKELSVRYKHLELGQINQKDYEAYK